MASSQRAEPGNKTPRVSIPRAVSGCATMTIADTGTAPCGRIAALLSMVCQPNGARPKTGIAAVMPHSVRVDGRFMLLSSIFRHCIPTSDGFRCTRAFDETSLDLIRRISSFFAGISEVQRSPECCLTEVAGRYGCAVSWRPSARVISAIPIAGITTLSYLHFAYAPLMLAE